MDILLMLVLSKGVQDVGGQLFFFKVHCLKS